MLKAVASRYEGDREELFSSLDKDGKTPLERAKLGEKVLNIKFLEKEEWKFGDRTFTGNSDAERLSVSLQSSYNMTSQKSLIKGEHMNFK